MSRAPHLSRHRTAAGFTLIEVIAALVIFSVGVLMVGNVTGALSRQMTYAATTSELVVRAQERVDSLESTPFDSLSAGTTVRTLTINGVSYEERTEVAAITGLLYQLDVILAPFAAGGAPSYSATSYVATPW